MVSLTNFRISRPVPTSADAAPVVPNAIATSSVCGDCRTSPSTGVFQLKTYAKTGTFARLGSNCCLNLGPETKGKVLSAEIEVLKLVEVPQSQASSDGDGAVHIGSKLSRSE